MRAADGQGGALGEECVANARRGECRERGRWERNVENANEREREEYRELGER